MAAVAALERDAELMLRVKEGDAASFERLLERHRSPVVRFMYRMVSDQAAAEDLAQEVFLRVYRARGTYEPAAKFTTWLFRIATHVALNWIRDGRKERAPGELGCVEGDGGAREIPDGGPTPEQQLLREARLEEVRQAVMALPDRQRAAVLLHKYEGMEYVQIGRVLSCSESAVKSLLFRAYETLRMRLAHLA